MGNRMTDILWKQTTDKDERAGERGMNKRIGYLYLVITCFIWGSVYIAGKYALSAMGPFTVLGFRYVVSALALGLLLKIKGCKRKVDREDWKYIWIVGGLGYFTSIAFQMVGMNLLNASMASLINGMNPIGITFLAAVFLKEKILPRHIAGIAVSMAGVYVILGVGGGNISMVGVAASICAVLLWSTASVAIRRISGKYNPIQISLFGILVALLFVLPSAAWEMGTVRPANITGDVLLACIYMGIAGTAIAHTLWNMSLSLLNASTCSMFYPLQPLTSAVLGVLILHEVLDQSFVAGGILICTGVVISVVERRKT